LIYQSCISTRTGGCSIISAQASPPTSGLVVICTPAWRGGTRTTNWLLPDPIKNMDSHEGQEMHALPQKEMLTFDSLMVEPHIRRASSSEHDAAISKVIMLGEEWEPPHYKAAGDRMGTFVPHVVASTTQRSARSSCSARNGNRLPTSLLETEGPHSCPTDTRQFWCIYLDTSHPCWHAPQKWQRSSASWSRCAS